jgi:hypothetical protein
MIQSLLFFGLGRFYDQLMFYNLRARAPRNRTLTKTNTVVKKEDNKDEGPQQLGSGTLLLPDNERGWIDPCYSKISWWVRIVSIIDIHLTIN